MAVKTKKQTLVLLDVHAIIHRAYHALPDFTGSTGEPTGALYGLSSMLIKIIRELAPDYIVACYDMEKPTFRHDAYKEYKAGRSKADTELVSQIKRSYDIFKAFGIPVRQSEGFEADDIIGTIAWHHKSNCSLSTIIASGDMDTLQLVSGKRIQVFTLKKGITETVLYDEGRVTERFGFPPKYLPDYKGLRGDPSDNIIGVTGVGDKTATELVCRYGTLENLYKVIGKDIGILTRAGFRERIVDLLVKGKEDALFSKVLAQIRTDAPIEYSLPDKTWRETADKESIRSIFADLGFRSLLNRLDELLPRGGDARERSEAEERVDEREAKEIGVALWLLDSTITNPTTQDILNFARTHSWDEARRSVLSRLEEEGLRGVYEEIELPLVPIIAKMEKRGVLVDTAFLRKLSTVYHKELAALERAIWKEAGGEFNINSPKQLSEVLFGTLKIKTTRIKRTTTGARSTRASELEKMRGEHPVVDKLLEYREYQKLLSTYIDNIPALLDKGGRLHTHFIQTGTTTGRIASQNPNLQNIPIKTELGRRIRRAFVASPGYLLLSCDYSQVELRVAALLSGDEKLKNIFKEGEDVHAATAAEIFKVPLRVVSADMRRAAKTINFGILYGMGVNALRENLGTSREEATAFYDKYFDTFTTLADYLERVKDEARRRGYTETYFGRRRHFPGLTSSLPHIRAAEERMAINAPIQGTATADIIKIAMSRVDRVLRERGFGDQAFLLLQVHDELVLEVKQDIFDRVVRVVQEAMEGVLESDVPFVVDASCGRSWGELKKIARAT